MPTRLLILIMLCSAGCSTSPTPARQARDQQGISSLSGSIEERKVPYSEELRYPDNWPEISAARDAGR